MFGCSLTYVSDFAGSERRKSKAMSGKRVIRVLLKAIVSGGDDYTAPDEGTQKL